MKMNEKRRALFDAVSGIDPALVQEATAPKSSRVLHIVRRAAAAAAMLAVMIGMFIGLPGKDSEPAPFFSIHVYANETDIVELSTDSESFIVSNVVDSNASTDLPGLNSAPPSDKAPEPKFLIEVWLGTDVSIWFPSRGDERPNLTVTCNGVAIEEQNDEDITIGFLASTTSDEVGYGIMGKVDELTNLQIILTAPDGTLLQKSDIQIAPIAAGGYEVTLVNSYVTDEYKIDIAN